MLLNSIAGRLWQGDVHMDESTPKGRKIPEKRPWTGPVLKKLDVGWTSAKDDGLKATDGGTGHLQHS
jgi:hypothetical protein